MSETNWTLGPWDAGSYEVDGPDGSLICNMSGWRDPTRTRANARLIAAAPELYEALVKAEAKLCIAEELLGLSQDDSPDFEVEILTARAALAKARGEQ